MDSNLKEELTDLFQKSLGITYSHRQSANGNITSLFQWLTLPSCVRDSLYDKYMLFTHFYLMQGNKIEAWFVSVVSRYFRVVEPTTF